MTPLTPEEIAEAEDELAFCRANERNLGQLRVSTIYAFLSAAERLAKTEGERDLWSKTWSAWKARAENAEARLVEMERVLVKIDAIRNSIIGTQTVNWSAHVYPLVAALGEVGLKGEGYDKARANALTLLEARDRAEQRLAEVERQLAEGFKIFETHMRGDLPIHKQPDHATAYFHARLWNWIGGLYDQRHASRQSKEPEPSAGHDE